MQMPSGDKAALRPALRARRRARAADGDDGAGDILAQAVAALLQGCEIMPPAIVAGYWALDDEINPAKTLQHLRALGYRTALPVTQGRDAGLVFRLADSATPLRKSSFGVMEPSSGEEVMPDVVLVPLLGFDDRCQRLGYGAGHYDRTLAGMRAHRDVFAAGLAFDVQRVGHDLPAEDHDQPLDCIITEKGVYWPSHSPQQKG